MAPKYVRHIGQVERLVRDYKDEITGLKKKLETEEDLKTRALHQETLAENMQALENLEKFLDDNGDIFK